MSPSLWVKQSLNSTFSVEILFFYIAFFLFPLDFYIYSLPTEPASLYRQPVMPGRCFSYFCHLCAVNYWRIQEAKFTPRTRQVTLEMASPAPNALKYFPIAVLHSQGTKGLEFYNVHLPEY